MFYCFSGNHQTLFSLVYGRRLQFMGGNRPGGDILLVLWLNPCSLLTTTKSNTPGLYPSDAWCKQLYMMTEKHAAAWWCHFGCRVRLSLFSTPLLHIIRLWLLLLVMPAIAWLYMLKRWDKTTTRKWLVPHRVLCVVPAAQMRIVLGGQPQEGYREDGDKNLRLLYQKEFLPRRG